MPTPAKTIRLIAAAAAIACQTASADTPAPAPSLAAVPKDARSVHLRYKSPFGDAAISAVEGSVTVRIAQERSFYMCMGFACGYCGFQQLSGGRRVFIFSVWDPGDPFDFSARPDNVPKARQTVPLYAREGVRINRFGGEGTGGQAMMDYDWIPGRKESVRITCGPDGEGRTAFTAWLADREKPGEWIKMVTFSTVHSANNPLKQAHSFIEDFFRNGVSATRVRRADFTGVAFTDANGVRKPCETAVFTADSNPITTIDALPAPDGWTLVTGGNTRNATTKLWGAVPRGGKSATPAEGAR